MSNLEKEGESTWGPSLPSTSTLPNVLTYLLALQLLHSMPPQRYAYVALRKNP
uniref:Uncharacterized protein n=1 Tax=Tetraselmis sp. GSL018 TaxID=582737 RepID=A0A061RH59_9CHLO